MKPTTNSLTYSQCLWTALIVALWVLLFIVIMVAFPSNSHSTPTFWLFITSILVLLFSIKRFGGNIKKTLGFNRIHIFWGLFAIGLGVGYWFVDFWFIHQLFNLDPSEAIQSWRQANVTYLPITVLISSVIMAPLFEELFFRGLMFRTMAGRMHWLLAASISAVLFALIHWSWPEFISLFAVGLIYALSTHKSGSVIPAIIAHMVHNLITFGYYVF